MLLDRDLENLRENERARHTESLAALEAELTRMRDEMASGNLSSVIYDAPRRTGASIVTAKRDRDVLRIRRDPPTCGHCVLAQCVDYRSWFCRQKSKKRKKIKRI